jgi:hypothetical protein
MLESLSFIECIGTIFCSKLIPFKIDRVPRTDMYFIIATLSRQKTDLSIRESVFITGFGIEK